MRSCSYLIGGGRVVRAAVLALAFLLLGLTQARAATLLLDDFPIADRTINVQLLSGNTLYVGGFFNYLGKNTGMGRSFDLATGAIDPGQKIWGSNLQFRGIDCVIGDGAGGWYVGGFFDRVGNTPVSNLIHVLADGTLDPAFTCLVSDRVRTMLLVGTKLYIGGDFTLVNGEAANYTANIDPVTGAKLSHNLGTNGSVRAMTLLGTKLYMGGNFTTAFGSPFNYLCYFDVITGNLPNWRPSLNGPVGALATSASTLYVLGSFTQVAGVARHGACALDPVSDYPAKTWNLSAAPDHPPTCLALSGSRVLLGGPFTAFGTSTRNHLAAVDATSGNLQSWDPNVGTATDTISAITVSGSTVYVGGQFSAIGGIPRHDFAALGASGGGVLPWDSSADRPVDAIAIQGGKIYLGGRFSSVGGKGRSNLGAIDVTTGTVLPWGPVANEQVYALIKSNSIIYVGGSFSSINGVTRHGLATCDASTGALGSWSSGVNNQISALALGNSRLYVGGSFSLANGQHRLSLAAFSTVDGSLTDWVAGADGYVDCVALVDSTLFVGGLFRQPNGNNAPAFIALSTVTGANTGWNSQANGYVHSILIAGSTMYVGGDFTSMSGEVRHGLAAFTTTGLPLPWGSASATYLADGGVNALAISPGSPDLILAGGRFTSLDPTVSGNMIALTTDGAVKPLYLKTDQYGTVRSLAANGTTAFLGGIFTSIANRFGSPSLMPHPNLAEVPVREFGTYISYVGVFNRLKTAQSRIGFDVRFEQPVNDFTPASVTILGTTGATTVTIEPSTVTGEIGMFYHVVVSGMLHDGMVGIDIPAGAVHDQGGEGNSAAIIYDPFPIYDTTGPTVTINQASDQVDPTSSITIRFTAVFSRPVDPQAYLATNLGGTAGATTTSYTFDASNTVMTVTVSGMSQSGTVTANLLADMFWDANGHPNLASTSSDNLVNYISAGPSVIVNQSAGQADPANAAPISFTAVFAAPVTGFDNTGVVLGGTAGATTAVVSGSGRTYTIAVSGVTGPGTVQVSIAAGAARDTSSRPSQPSTSSDNVVTYDPSAPPPPPPTSAGGGGGGCGMGSGAALAGMLGLWMFAGSRLRRADRQSKREGAGA